MSQNHDAERQRGGFLNFRKTLRTSAALALGVFFLALVGSILWIFDEFLDWDILPDWLESCASAIVTILIIVSVFAVLTNLVSAVTVVADSLAERFSGPARPGGTRRVALWAAVFAAALIAVLAGFQQVSKVRTRRLEQAWEAQRRAEDRELYGRILASLRASADEFAAKFPAALADELAAGLPTEREKEVAEYLRSLTASLPYAPSSWIVVRGDSPYLYQSLSAKAGWTKDSEGAVRHLGRENLVGLPSAWERDTVAALFQGAELDVPHGRGGVVIDTKEPCAWKAIRAEGKVVGLLVLRVPNRAAFRTRKPL